MAKKGVSLAIGRGEKLPASQGAGLTAKGRAKYNRATGSNLKPPVTTSKPSKSEAGRRASFCARMGGIVKTAKNSERARASMRRWKCR
jgi:hypothetical protein